MPLRSPVRLILAVFLLLGFPASRLLAMSRRPVAPPFIYVAHAGGGYQGWIHTSSVEAMEQSYANGYRIFEVDLELTSDRKVVLVHDWETFSHFAYLRGRPTLDQYEHLKMRYGFRPPTLEGLQDFLKKHPKAMVILDTKWGHYGFLKYVAVHYPDIVPQALPHIFAEKEYEPVRKLGYRNLIFACYGSPINDNQLLNMLDRHRFFAVSAPAERGWSRQAQRCDGEWCLPSQLSVRGVKLILHVLNRKVELNWARRIGASGIMSDWLLPDKAQVPALEKEMAGWRKNPV